MSSRKQPIHRAAILTRDYIHSSLYAKEKGYFATRDVLHAVRKPLLFQTMWGEKEYRKSISDLYTVRSALESGEAVSIQF